MLGIESSCDDTGVAVVRASDGVILGQAVTGQVHKPARSMHDECDIHYYTAQIAFQMPENLRHGLKHGLSLANL